MPVDDAPASQFYKGLAAELYGPLASIQPRADDYVPFLEGSGTPALELCCGSGLPLLELVERGYEVEGLDASQDMVDLCAQAAASRGLAVTLHVAEMQTFSLPRRYRSIFLAGPSFTLLTSDEDAAATLARVHAHLEPQGSVLIPLEVLDPAALEPMIGRVRQATSDDGTLLRVSALSQQAGADGCSVSTRLRYERIAHGAAPELLEREFRQRWWSQDRFRQMLVAAGFERITFLAPEGGRAAADAALFVALAQRS